jgi:hypothetical protein
MRIEIEDSTIEDLVREALDGVDIVGQVDVEELVLNEIQELNLLEGIDVKSFVRSAINDAVEDSDDFNAFMKMRDVVESLELQLGALSTKYNSLLKIVESQGDEITFMRTVLLDVERKQSNPWYKFWN